VKKVLFIAPYPRGVAPSQRFRFEQYLTLLSGRGIRTRFAAFWSLNAWELLYTRGKILKKVGFFLTAFLKRLTLVLSVSQYDFIFIHREALPIGPPVLEFFIAKILRKRIIYDFDDAIWLPNTSKQNRIIKLLKYHGKVKQICRWSWKVSCGNDFLAQYSRQYNQNTVLNPTTIDMQYHLPSRQKNSKVTVGWTGTHSTSKYLNTMSSAFTTLRQRHDFDLLIISNKAPDWTVEDYRFVKWSKETEIATLNTIDIGIMPLEDSDWERGKCGLKLLQYMALEIPAVASDIGVNNQIVDHGKNGYLCRNEADWINNLAKLIESQALRKQLGKQGRKKVEDHYSLKANTRRFLSLFA
jgi:glycosyltransferase involved in cell wall biosynthesis